MKEPKIRFKGFQGEWENTPFSENFDSLKNNSLSRAELSDSGEVMNIHYGDVLIKYGECVDVIKEVETFVKDEEVAKKLHQSCAIKNGDVIFADAAEDNTVGKCSEVIANENDAIVSGLHTIACRPKKDFAPMYLGYYLNSNAYHDQLLPHIQGTKISSISKKAISQTHINSPLEKDEQQSIASYFQHLDSLIQSTTKKIESLKQVKAASLQSMFPQEGETTPRVRFKGFEGEWETAPLGSLVNIYDGVHQTPNYKDRGIMFLSVEDISSLKSNKYISEEDFNQFYKVFPEKGDILMTRIGDVGTPNVVETNEKIAYYVSLALLKPKGVNSRFLSYCIQSHQFQKNLKLRTLTVAIPQKINKVEIGKVECTYSSNIKEQESIASYFTNLDRQISLQTQRLEKLKQIKSACLDNMFV